MKAFREQSIESMQQVVNDWKAKRNFTWESKKLYVNLNPSMPGELVLHVSNSVDSFFRNQQLINTFLLSSYFITGTLGDAPLSDNPKADAYGLQDFLDKFDEEFYKSVDDKLTGEGITTSDPLF
jgi:hypothetical protein